jgi:hypothetical protein
LLRPATVFRRTEHHFNFLASKMATAAPSAAVLLRGPILIASASFTFLLPYLSQVSVESILKLAVIGCGLFWFCLDLANLAENRIRSSLSTFLNGIVLDDVLKSIYDPEFGLIATVVGTVVGNATMYTLPMNSEQRTKLIQASYWVNKTQARSILSNPGGFKLLLPEKLQQWLEIQQEASPSQPEKILIGPDADADSSSDGGLDSDDDRSDHVSRDFPETPTKEPEIRQRQIPRRIDAQLKNCETEDMPNRQRSAAQPTPIDIEENPTDPVKVMFGIMRDMVSEKLQIHAQSIPESTIETVGMTAFVALAIHLMCRRNARKAVGGALEGIFALGLSGVAAGAFSTVFARHILLGNIQDGKTLQIVAGGVAARIGTKLKRMAAKNSKFKGIVAVFVLALLGSRKRAR